MKIKMTKEQVQSVIDEVYYDLTATIAPHLCVVIISDDGSCHTHARNERCGGNDGCQEVARIPVYYNNNGCGEDCEHECNSQECINEDCDASEHPYRPTIGEMIEMIDIAAEQNWDL